MNRLYRTAWRALLAGTLGAIVPLGVQAGQDASSEGRACAVRVAELGAWLKDLQAAANLSLRIFPGQLGVRLVAHQGGAVPSAPLVELVDDRIGVDGRLLDIDSSKPIGFEARLAMLETSLAELARMYALLHPGETPAKKVAVAVDRDVSWEHVVALAKRLAKAGITSVAWCFSDQRPIRLAPPRPSSIHGNLQAVVASKDPTQKAAILGELARKVLTPCPGAHRVFSDLGAFAPDDKLPTLLKDLPPAISGCACSIDVGALEELLFGVWGTPPGATLFSALPMRLAFSQDKGAKPVALTAATPWSSAFQAVIDAAGTGAEIFLKTVGETKLGKQDGPYVLVIEFRKPHDQNARTFVRKTHQKLYRSPSTGIFTTRVSRDELKQVFGLDLQVTNVQAAGNSSHADASFVRLKNPKVMKKSLRPFVVTVRIEDDPKFENIDDGVEVQAQ
jgi:hypothetical protein